MRKRLIRRRQRGTSPRPSASRRSATRTSRRVRPSASTPSRPAPSSSTSGTPRVPPCRLEMPHFEAAFQTHKDEVAFVAIQQLGLDSEEEGQKFVEEFGLTYAVGPDTSGTVIKDYSYDLPDPRLPRCRPHSRPQVGPAPSTRKSSTSSSRRSCPRRRAGPLPRRSRDTEKGTSHIGKCNKMQHHAKNLGFSPNSLCGESLTPSPVVGESLPPYSDTGAGVRGDAPTLERAVT